MKSQLSQSANNMPTEPVTTTTAAPCICHDQTTIYIILTSILMFYIYLLSISVVLERCRVRWLLMIPTVILSPLIAPVVRILMHIGTSNAPEEVWILEDQNEFRRYTSY